MGRIRCTDCLNIIDTHEDPFCMVTPHGARYLHRAHIPLCPDCRFKEGYDIRASYEYVNKQYSQPPLKLLPKPDCAPETTEAEATHKIEAERISEIVLDAVIYEEVLSNPDNSTVETDRCAD